MMWFVSCSDVISRTAGLHLDIILYSIPWPIMRQVGTEIFPVASAGFIICYGETEMQMMFLRLLL